MKGRIFQRVLNMFRVGSYGEHRDGLRQWFTSPYGQLLLKKEQAHLCDLLTEFRGQNILQLSPLSMPITHLDSPFRRLIRVEESSLNPQSEPESHVLAAFEYLPFEDDSIDVVVVHHLLEFSDNPQQVLKEAARVTKNGGHLIVFCFNPISVAGLVSLALRYIYPKSVWARKSLVLLRIRDWLKFLDCTNLGTRYIVHDFPINNARYLKLASPLFSVMQRINLPLSTVFCSASRKDKMGMNLLEPDWKTAMLKRALTVRKPAQPARIAVRTNTKEKHNLH